MKIRLLSPEVVDQIAAGEVVERPAHLVKELLENSLDAGATVIEVEFDQGGRSVRVTDNGRGIEPEDLPLALARHATSKIEASADLWSLSTFGFRGEALATISAVSRLTLQSRTANASHASRLVSQFGTVGDADQAGGNPGTTIQIEELFANVPARLKFLKSESAESTQIKNVIKALALANRGVEFRVKSGGKLVQVYPKAESFQRRAEQVLAISPLYTTVSEADGYRVEIAFSSPHEVSGTSRNIWLFVQGRWVQDRSLQAAVMDAYRGLLMHGEFPIAAVLLTCPPDELDVNIHPSKSQVKFRETQRAFRAVHRCLREALEQAPWLDTKLKSMAGAAAASPSAEVPVNLGFTDQTFQDTQYRQRFDPVAAVRAATEAYAQSSIETYPDRPIPESPYTRRVSGSTSVSEPSHSPGGTQATQSPVSSPSSEGAVPAPLEAGSDRRYWSRLQVLGQANLTYIVTQTPAGLVFVDQHAAHERVVYERLMRAWREGQIEVQDFLLPVTLDLEPEQLEALLGVAEELGRLGLQIDRGGPATLAIRSVPSLINEAAAVKVLEQMARELVEKGGSFALEKRIGDLCATMACHSVVRAGQALSQDQMKSLLDQMDEFPLSSFCPHGRPVSVDYGFSKLERDFGRIV